MESIKLCNGLEKLNLSGNKLDNASMELLGKSLRLFPSLAVLNLASNEISDDGVQILYPYLENNKSLTFLGLSKNFEITMKSYTFFISICENTNIELGLRQTPIRNENSILLNSLKFLYQKKEKMQFSRA